jgi:hypothetical protein
MELIAELARQPVMVAALSAIINLLVAAIALGLRRRATAPGWLGACAVFHLLSAMMFALVSVQLRLTASDAPAEMTFWAAYSPVILLSVSTLLGLTALLLANLTERLTLAPDQRPSLPLLPAAAVIALVEGILFALRRPDLGYLVSEGAWLMVCILITAGLLRLRQSIPLLPLAQVFAVLTACSFFAHALVALPVLIQTAIGLLLPRTSMIGATLPGIGGEILAHIGSLKIIINAWSGFGLLLLAITWGVD